MPDKNPIVTTNRYPFIYYDYLENGQLQGGRLELDHKNPFHSSLGKGYQTLPMPAFNASVIESNGNTDNRIDIVFVGDGYRADELAQYRSEVGNIIDPFFNDEILSEYRSYFNIHRVDVVSNESGVDNDPNKGILKDTALDMMYFCGEIERLLCVNVDKAMLAAQNALDVDQVIAVANSSKHGGAGYPGLGTLPGKNLNSIGIAIHEFGHSFAELADEYDYGGVEVYTGPELDAVNVSILNSLAMANQNKKWHKWLGQQGVSTYEGARYSKFGIFRPTQNSIMREFGQPWGPVNKEQMIKKIYTAVSPVDSVVPDSDKLSRDLIYKVNILTPVGRTLNVQWWLDDVLVASNTDSYDGINIPNDGNKHTLAVRVTDQTSDVRDEGFRQNFMTAEHIWTTNSTFPFSAISLLLLSDDEDKKIPNTSCAAGGVYDCRQNCISTSIRDSWVGDNACDDGTYSSNDLLTNELTPTYLNCPAFGNDGGDCN